MPAPTNISAATATDLGTFPASVSQNVHDAGTTYDVWYKFTSAAAGVRSIWGHGDYATLVYSPTLTLWTGPASAPVAYLPIVIGINEPVVFPVSIGETYYLKFATNGGNPTPAVLEIEAATHAPTASPAGSLSVNDDDPSFPLALLSSATSGEVDRYLISPLASGFAAGEDGDVLNTGVSLINVFGIWSLPVGGSGCALYNASYTQIATPLLGETVQRVSSNHTTTFYVLTFSSPNYIVKTVSAAGVVGATTFNLGTTQVTGMAPNPEGTILYYRNTAANIIRRWDLVNNVALSDLVNPGTAITMRDIICLGDGSVLFGRNSGANVVIVRYSAAGALLNTYTMTGTSGSRMTRGVDDTTTFWVWKNNANPSLFREIRASDGTVLKTIEHGNYRRGVYLGSISTQPEADAAYVFGSSDSCPFWITRTAFDGDSPIQPGFNTETRRRRWLRRSPVYSKENTRVVYDLFQLDGTVGSGNANEPGLDPQVYMRTSDDGGHTWSYVRARSAGLRGKYGTQMQWWRLGQGRNKVIEVYGSDPVPVALYDGFARVRPGTDGD